MSAPNPPGHDALPLADWPLADRRAWEQARRPGDLFEEGGRAGTWRPVSRDSVAETYGRWLGYLSDRGVALEVVEPAARLTPENLRAYRGYLRERCTSTTVASYLGQLHMMVVALFPRQDWAWLRELQAQQQRLATPSRQKAARLLPAADLLALGQALMCEAEAAPPGRTAPDADHPALLHRDGLLIALLISRPLRQRNLLGLRLGCHLLRQGNGWDIRIPVTETKNHRPLEVAFPSSLVPALERYLSHYRPLLLAMRGADDPALCTRDATQSLWVTRYGGTMTAGGLQKLLQRRLVPRFGHSIGPHLFRDCAATSLGVEDPENVRMAARILGHGSFHTTERHYIAALQGHALKHHQDGIATRRRAVVTERSDQRPSPALAAKTTSRGRR